MKSAAFESTLSPAYSPELVQLPAFEWTCHLRPTSAETKKHSKQSIYAE
jgi:hypothetical protein